MEQAYAAAGTEPPLEELLDDQIARLIMRRDGLGPADVWRSIGAARARLADRTLAHAADERLGPDAILEPAPARAAGRQTRSSSA